MTTIFDSDAPMSARRRHIEVSEVDITTDSSGNGNATVNFDQTIDTNNMTNYAVEVVGTTPAETAVDKSNEEQTSIPVHIGNAAASITVTVMVTRFAERWV